MLHRAVVFHIHGELPFEARMLMEDFRLAANCAIRAGLQAKVTSRNALVKLAYKDFRKSPPISYIPETVLSLDTNERSLDSVFMSEVGSVPIRAAYPDVAIIQARHHDRRKRLQKRKAHDRRTSRWLCRREGKREHHRIEYRMHQVANAVLGLAEEHKSTIVLEDLNGMIGRKRGKSLNRRLSSWPRKMLHDFIEYKAAWIGVPVIKVDPYNSSRRCPICGRLNHSRMGSEFECECGWRADRHVNAGINLLNTAFPEGMAGGLRFSPGAFQHDVVMTLCDPFMGARSEPNGTSRSVGRS